MKTADELQQELERERIARQHTESLLEITRQQLAEQQQLNALLDQQKAYRELVETVSDIIYRADENGFFTYVNPTGIRITEYAENELIGVHFLKLVRSDFRSQLMSYYFLQMKEKIRSTYTEFPIVTKSGTEIWVGQTVDLHDIDNDKTEFIALCRDVSDRKKAEQALILSEDKYRSIIENLELGLLEVDMQGFIVKAYPQFCLLTGYSAEELKGKLPESLLIDEESRTVIAHQMEKRQRGQSSVYEMELIRKDGTRIWVIVSGAPYYNEKNEMAGTVGIHLDITARKQMEKELIQANEIAEKSLRSKDLFMANMSHEIRTPMNAIIGMSRLLADSDLSEKQQDYVQAIQTSSENLLAIVNDLLDFSKLEAGKMELELIPGDLRKTIHSSTQLLDLKIAEKGLLFEKHIDLQLAPHYLFDPTRLNGVLTNLLDNAMKFTQSGKICLDVRVEEQQEDSDVIAFEVRDTGIGIPEDKLPGIFDSFVQAESSTTRKYGGTGLGLSIAKDLVHLMGGELRVRSEVGRGSLFHFTLRFTKSCDLTPVPEQTYDQRTIEGLRILIVDDNKINRFMAQTILEQWNASVVSAENGAEAVDLLKQQAFDLVLMDMQMPVLDGLQATVIIRNVLKLDLPVIALTANAVKGEAEKCLEAGMNGFISKPFKQEDLLQAISDVLNATSDLSTLPYPLSETTLMESLSDLELLHRSTLSDEPFMRRMLLLVIDETARKSADIEGLLATRNYEEIRKIVHSMKPSIDHVAVSSIRTLLREVEEGTDSTELAEAQTRKLLRLLAELMEELKTHPLLEN